MFFLNWIQCSNNCRVKGTDHFCQSTVCDLPDTTQDGVCCLCSPAGLCPQLCCVPEPFQQTHYFSVTLSLAPFSPGSAQPVLLQGGPSLQVQDVFVPVGNAGSCWPIPLSLSLWMAALPFGIPAAPLGLLSTYLILKQNLLQIEK